VHCSAIVKTKYALPLCIFEKNKCKKSETEPPHTTEHVSRKKINIRNANSAIIKTFSKCFGKQKTHRRCLKRNKKGENKSDT
jgi:hypothetical protein